MVARLGRLIFSFVACEDDNLLVALMYSNMEEETCLKLVLPH